MAIVPAVGLGFLAVFLVGAGITYLIMNLIEKWQKGDVTIHRSTTQRVDPDYLDEDEKNKIALAGGGAAVVLLIILLLSVPTALAIGIMLGITVIGILFGLATFVIFDESNSKTKTQPRPADTQSRFEAERERQKHQAETQAKASEIKRKQAEIEAIQDDLDSILGIFGFQNPKREKLLADVLNKLFEAYEIPVKEAFDPVEHAGIADHIEGVVEIDGCVYLVEMKWSKGPPGIPEVAPHLVRLFNRNYSGGILISNAQFSPSAISACKDALSQKTVVLCELKEVVSLLKQNGSLKDFLKAKITFAVIHKNPLFKPLSQSYKK